MLRRLLPLAPALLFASPALAQDAVPVPALYAPLLTDGASMGFDVLVESAMYDDQDPAAGEDGYIRRSETSQATCTVRALFHDATAAASEITCDGEGGQLAGYWAADAEGLWQLTAEPADSGAVNGLRATLQPAIAAAPHGSDEAFASEEGFGSRRVVERSGDGWCVRRESWGGDESSLLLCFAEGTGITTMISAWSGGSDQSTTWTRNDLDPAPAEATSQPTTP